MYMKLEVITLPVSDVERAKTFYAQLGFREDIDLIQNDFRVVQFTPPGSKASIFIGKNITSAQPGSTQGLILVVDDIEAAHQDLLDKGIEVTEMFHDDNGLFYHTHKQITAPGPHPERKTYGSFFAFTDPDSNGWVVQEITERLPGRVQAKAEAISYSSPQELATAMQRAEAAHGAYEQTLGHRDKDWPTWYAQFMQQEQAKRLSQGIGKVGT